MSMQDDTQKQPITEPVTEDTTTPEPPKEDPQDETDTTIVDREGTGDETESDLVTASTEPDEDTEVREETGSEDTKTALGIMQVEDLINRQMADIDKMREEVKLLKSSFEDAFKNDAKYREFDEKVKEATRLKKTYVLAMKKDPSITAAEQSFMSKRDDLKDAQQGLSEYLREYNRISGLTQFETQDGQVLQIVQVFKLVKNK